MRIEFNANSFFLGERLKEIREGRGLTISQLASLTGISKQSLSCYEKNSQKPRKEAVNKLMEVLGINLAYFQKELPNYSSSPVFFRSLANLQKKERLRAKTQLGWFEDLFGYLSNMIDFPLPKIPAHLGIGKRISKTGLEEIDAIAAETRRFWGLGNGPIPDLTRLMENNGIVIIRMDLDIDQEDAFSQWQGERPVIVNVAETLPACRKRFTLAHELGHLILHSGVESIELENLPILEKQAHRFASAFLMPDNTWAREFYVPDLESFKILKGRWKVSIAAQIRRARDLNLISEQRMRELYIGIAKRKWRTKEPLDNEIPVEQTHMLKDAIELLRTQAGIDFPEIAAAISLPEADIRVYCGLPPANEEIEKEGENSGIINFDQHKKKDK